MKEWGNPELYFGYGDRERTREMYEEINQITLEHIKKHAQVVVDFVFGPESMSVRCGSS